MDSGSLNIFYIYEEQKRKISEANKGRKKPEGFKPSGRLSRKATYL